MSTSIEILVAQMSVAELAQRSGRSVSQLVELAFGSSAASAVTPAKRGPGRPPGAGAKKGKRGKGKAAKAAPAKAAPAKAEAKAAPKAVGKKGAVDTRAASGRANYDETVLAAIRGAKGKVKAADLRSKLGGTPLQIRAALHRLIEGSKIKVHGQARGTTYTAA